MTSGLIDVHAHFVTDEYVRQATAAGHEHPDGMPGWPRWDPEQHLALMDRHGIARSLLSISSPGVAFGPAVALAEHVNDTAAEVSARHPARFGFFASLPLPDVGAALHELRRAFDDLGAEGVVLMSNVDGRYLGDPEFEPVYAELERRGAPLFVHPTSPMGWESVSANRPRPMLEFPFETTRTIADLVLNGVLDRHPDLKVIVPHGGAALPLLADRIDGFQRAFTGATGPTMNDYLRRLWFDTAGSPFPHQIPALEAAAGIDHLLYGSDYCWNPTPAVDALMAAIDARPDRDWRTLTTKNAKRLLNAPPGRPRPA